jgi:hypothetical protein
LVANGTILHRWMVSCYIALPLDTVAFNVVGFPAIITRDGSSPYACINCVTCSSASVAIVNSRQGAGSTKYPDQGVRGILTIVETGRWCLGKGVEVNDGLIYINRVLVRRSGFFVDIVKGSRWGRDWALGFFFWGFRGENGDESWGTGRGCGGSTV